MTKSISVGKYLVVKRNPHYCKTLKIVGFTESVGLSEIIRKDLAGWCISRVLYIVNCTCQVQSKSVSRNVVDPQVELKPYSVHWCGWVGQSKCFGKRMNSHWSIWWPCQCQQQAASQMNYFHKHCQQMLKCSRLLSIACITLHCIMLHGAWWFVRCPSVNEWASHQVLHHHHHHHGHHRSHFVDKQSKTLLVICIKKWRARDDHGGGGRTIEFQPAVLPLGHPSSLSNPSSPSSLFSPCYSTTFGLGSPKVINQR